MLVKSLSSHGYKVLNKQRTSKQAIKEGRKEEREGGRERRREGEQTNIVLPHTHEVRKNC